MRRAPGGKMPLESCCRMGKQKETRPMTTANLERVLREILTLDPEERRQLQEMLEMLERSAAAPPPQTPEEKLDQALLKAGLISRIPPPITDLTPYKNRKLATVKGRPTSEILVEERR